MESVGHVLVTLGAVLVAGLAAEWTHGHVPLPRVSLLMLLGVLVGPVGVDLLPSEQEQWFPVVAALTLTMVFELIGPVLTGLALRRTSLDRSALDSG